MAVDFSKTNKLNGLRNYSLLNFTPMFIKEITGQTTSLPTSKLIKKSFFVFLLFLVIFFYISNSYGSNCGYYLTEEQQNTLSRNPYLFSMNSIGSPEGLSTITESVETIYGPVILRTKDLKGQKKDIEAYGQDPWNIEKYINGILVGILQPGINHPQFLRWLQQSYEYSLHLRDVNFNLPSSGFKPDFLLRRNPEEIQKAGRTEAIINARASGNIAPMIFQIQPNTTGKPSEGLTKNEHIWLFRILMREPYIRKLLRKRSEFDTISEDEFHDIVFLISAFPELYALSDKLDRMGIIPARYQIIDGQRIEGIDLLLGRVQFEPLFAKLRLYKSFEGMTEHSFSSIEISGKGLNQMTPEQIAQLQNYIHTSWADFKDRFQTEFNLTNVDIAITTKNMFNVSVLSDLEENVKLTSLFYIYLLNGTRSFYF